MKKLVIISFVFALLVAMLIINSAMASAHPFSHDLCYLILPNAEQKAPQSQPVDSILDQQFCDGWPYNIYSPF